MREASTRMQENHVVRLCASTSADPRGCSLRYSTVLAIIYPSILMRSLISSKYIQERKSTDERVGNTQRPICHSRKIASGRMRFGR